MMFVFRRLQAKQCLQQSVKMSGLKQIFTARDTGHFLNSIIHDNRQVIAATDIFANQNDITRFLRFGPLNTTPHINPFQMTPDFGNSTIHIQTQCTGFTGSDSRLPLNFGQTTANRRIQRSFQAMWGTASGVALFLNIFTCAKTWIQQSTTLQLLGRRKKV